MSFVDRFFETRLAIHEIHETTISQVTAQPDHALVADSTPKHLRSFSDPHLNLI